MRKITKDVERRGIQLTYEPYSETDGWYGDFGKKVLEPMEFWEYYSTNKFDEIWLQFIRVDLIVEKISKIKLKLLIGASSSKIFHLNEFAKNLEKNNIECKVVFDSEYADGFPSRKIKSWFSSNKKFKKSPISLRYYKRF